MFNRFIFLLIIYSFISNINASNPSSSELHMKYGDRALDAFKHLLNFFETDASNLNLDGLYGLRIAQGQLIALNQQNNNKKNFSFLLEQIERIANTTLKQLENEKSSYLHRFSLVAYQPFIIEYKSKKIHKEFIENIERSGDFNEQESDQCFAELLGSTDKIDSQKCSTSEFCWNMMTSFKTKDYRLTHQLLWFLIGKTIGCIKEKLANKNLHNLEDYFCANIYHDAHENLKNNINQDLFLEQLLLCSIIGYEEFLRFDWFQTILTWQDLHYGCFNDQSETKRFHHHMKRHLLFEQEMNYGCLSHKSGLAAGLLATYTRFFLQ